MATPEQLAERKRELTKKLSDIQHDEKMTGAEKSAALDAMQEDFETVEKAFENTERASNMAAKLDGFGDARDEKGIPLDQFQAPNPFSPQAKANFAAEFATKMVKSYEAKALHEGDDRAFSISTKDSSATNNLMGENLYGSTGPTAIGQAPFGTGAFGPGIMPTWIPGIVETLFYELTLADLISSIPTQSDNLSYMTESLTNLQANQVAEGSGYPFSSIEVSRVYEQIGKIANAMTLTDEAIADAAYLFNFAQGRLLQSLQRQEEVQILAGGGVPGVNGLLTRGANFTATGTGSLFNASSSGTSSSVAFPPSGTVGANVVSQTIGTLHYGRAITGATGVYPVASVIAENIMDAFTDIELTVFKRPNAIVMNPRDWETVRLAKDSAGQYMGGSFFGSNYGQQANAGKSLWNCPVVTTPLMPQHLILTGWFDPSTIQTARRSGVTTQMTNSNGTDFVNGKITVRAEERLGLMVYRPTAFQLIQLISG